MKSAAPTALRKPAHSETDAWGMKFIIIGLLYINYKLKDFVLIHILFGECEWNSLITFIIG